MRILTKPEEVYIDFASKISFFEFTQEEFKNADVPLEDLQKELSILEKKDNWNISELSDFVSENPRSFIIFQNIFQLLRFTNAQIIHFVFDIATLNSININSNFEYMILNIKHDLEFRRVFLRQMSSGLDYDGFMEEIEDYGKRYLIAMFKSAISKYVSKITRNFDILEYRITKPEFADFSVRFSNYLLVNLKLNEILASIDVRRYLQNKRVPIDTKSIHGKYPKMRILGILEKEGYKNIDTLLNIDDIQTIKGELPKQLIENISKDEKIFCTERYIDGVIKQKDKKLKKFDLIIFSSYNPKYLFEINFYSTAGTKIGINQNEYIDLSDYIKKKFPNIFFYWITDGNYWLTSNGKTRFINLLANFDIIFNINTFAENLSLFR